MTITIDFNQIARIAKLVALLGFFLPWVTVSCSGTEIMKATGWQLMTGDPQLAGPLAGMAESQQRSEDAEPAVLVIAAFAIIAIGLGFGLAMRSRAAAAAMLATAVLGAAVSAYSIEHMRQEMRREMSSAQNEQSVEENPFFTAAQQREMTATIASAVTVEEEQGYYLTLGALIAAALLSLLTLFAKRTEAAEPPAPS